MNDPEVLIEVQYVHYSKAHDHVYSTGTRKLMTDGSLRRTRRMGFICECGEWMDDGEPCSEEAWNDGRVVHSRCVEKHL